jgi:periplasmic copper chaperone A
MKRRIFLALLLLPSLAQAHSSKLGNIAIGHSWALPSVTTEAQVMMPLINNGESSDSLISASSPVASSIELRNADHVETPLTLRFKNAGEIEIQIHIADKPGE